MTVTLQGGDQLLSALRKISKDAEAEIALAVEATAIELRGEIVKGYQKGPASGVTREKYNPRRTHTASAPGEAPATDTGRLASGTQYSMTGKATAEVSNAVKYGPYLEFGTQAIAPRPLWIPKTVEAQPKLVKRLEAALKRAMGQ
jgi:hypothetical protein